MTGAFQDAFHDRDRLWPAVLASVVTHLALGALAFVYRPPAALDPSQRPIVAKLVRLGEPRPPELLPRKEAPPPAAEGPPTPAPAPAVPAPAAAPAPSAKASAPKAPGPKPPAARAPPAPGARPAPGRLSSVLSELSKELQAGSPEGDPAGEASEGEGDSYLAAVVTALRQNYRLPTTISERERLYLTGSVVLFVEPSGAVTRSEIVKRSGNAAFDEALERAVRQTRLPPPPAARRELYRRTGLQVDFKI